VFGICVIAVTHLEAYGITFAAFWRFNVKGNVKVNFTQEQAMKDQRDSRDVCVLSL
jgi:hypothetical protein